MFEDGSDDDDETTITDDSEERDLDDEPRDKVNPLKVSFCCLLCPIRTV